MSVPGAVYNLQAAAPETSAAVAAPGAGPAVKSTNFVGASTFTTPAGTTVANVNSKVVCSS
jgi:hypothetical protein